MSAPFVEYDEIVLLFADGADGKSITAIEAVPVERDGIDTNAPCVARAGRIQGRRPELAAIPLIHEGGVPKFTCSGKKNAVTIVCGNKVSRDSISSYPFPGTILP